MKCCNGIVHSLESFGSADGPGVRFIAFMKGCHMRCKYCHNPDTWDCTDGKSYTAQELFEQAWKYHSYWGKDLKKGGVTVSGGEPLLQIEFVTEFFKILREHGVHTAIDTSGQPFNESEEFLAKFDELLKYTNLVLLDIKHIDSAKHKDITGFGNENILKMAKYLADKEIPVWIRHVLVPTLTDDDADLKKLGDFIRGLKNVERVDVLPYHTLGVFKWVDLGYTYPLEGIKAPSKESIEKAREYLKIN